MRKNRILIFSLMAVSLFFGLYTGDKIFFILLSILSIIVISSLIMGLWILIDFKYLQTIEPSLTEKGGNANLRIEIHNDRPFIYPYLKVYFRTPKEVIGGLEKEYVLSIMPFSHRIIDESFSCPLRGIYPIGIIGVQVQDLFGLFTFHIDLTKKAYYKQLSLVVHPRIIELAALPLHFVDMDEIQSESLSHTEDISSISDIRKYEYGDSLKKIHWKVSSKYQDLYVKEYETSSAPKTLIFLETIPYKIDGIAGYEIEDQLIECTIAIVNYMLEERISTELIMYNRDRLKLEGKTQYDFPLFYDTLSQLEFRGNFSIEQMLIIEKISLNSGYNIVLITHHLDFELFNRICILKRLGFHPILFLIEHRSYIDRDIGDMISQLKDIHIPSFNIANDQRIDQVLEDLI